MPFYGRRKGRSLSVTGAERARARLKCLSVERWFEKWPNNLWLEIGFGFGEHLLHWVSSYPHCSIVGAEVFENGVVSCVNGLRKEDEHRVAFFVHPVAELFDSLPESVLQGVIVRFPDPWPKRRHAGRRLIQDGFLDQCSRLVQSGGLLHFASDHEALVAFSHNNLDRHSRWSCVINTNHRPHGWCTSRYEDKALARGDVCHYSVWHRA